MVYCASSIVYTYIHSLTLWYNVFWQYTTKKVIVDKTYKVKYMYVGIYLNMISV